MVTDHQRDFEAARAGWMTIRLMFEELTGDPVDTAAGLAEMYVDRCRASA